MTMQTELPLRSLFSVWHKDYPEYVRTYDGKSASDARYSAYLSASDSSPEIRYIDFRARKLKSPKVIERDADRLAKANAIVKAFIPSVVLAYTDDGILVQWQTSSERHARIWVTDGNDHFPIWHKRAPWGGTCSTALSQVVYWLENKPVLPMGTWRHWFSVGLGRNSMSDAPDALRNALEAANWPEEIKCVLCGEPPEGGMDWWSYKHHGPCCWGAPSQCKGRRERDWCYDHAHWIDKS